MLLKAVMLLGAAALGLAGFNSVPKHRAKPCKPHNCPTTSTTATTTTTPSTTTSPTTTTQPTTTTTPPPPNNCTKTLTPTIEWDGTVNSTAVPGDVICLHEGHYGADPNSTILWNHLTVSGTASALITVRSYPGEMATIGGYTGIDSNYMTFTNLHFDGANSAGSVNSCGGQPHGVGVDSYGNNDVFDHVEVFSSLDLYMGSAFLLHGNDAVVRYSKIHGWGVCPSGTANGHDHGIYDGNGARAQIHHNWFWENGNSYSGWGVQLYPSPSDAHIYANIVDNSGSGFVNCSTGSNNLIENNVVTNSNGTGQVPGSLIDGCGPQGSTGHIVRNNDQFNNPGGFGSCNNPPAGETCSNNIPFDPQYADQANHNYTVLNPSLAGYGLWDGS